MKTDIVALPKSQIARLKGTTGIRSSAGNRFLAEPLRQMKVPACNKASITVKFLNALSTSRFQNPMLGWGCRKLIDKKVSLCYNVFHRVAVNSERGLSAASHCQLTSESV